LNASEFKLECQTHEGAQNALFHQNRESEALGMIWVCMCPSWTLVCSHIWMESTICWLWFCL